MKVLMLGGKWVSQGLWAIHEGFRKVGVDLAYVATRREKQDDLVTTVQISLDAEKVIRDWKPDILFWWNPRTHRDGAVCKKIVDFFHAQNPKGAAVYYTFDDPNAEKTAPDLDEWQALWEPFDLMITGCAGSVETYEAAGKQAVCMYHPPDEDMHGKAAFNVDHACDLSFAATNCYPRDKFPEQIVGRRELACAAAAIGDLRLYGEHSKNGWLSPAGSPDLGPWWAGYRKYRVMAECYRSSSINISSHAVRGAGYMSGRVPLCLGSGGFLLTDHVNGIEEIFKPGELLDTYITLEEFIDKAKWYLKNPLIRNRIAVRGQMYVMEHMNNVVFAKRILRLCESTKETV